jgi:nitrous oxidase accessory protein
MRLCRTILIIGLAALAAAGSSSLSRAERITVTPGEALQAVLDRAAEGNVVVLGAGVHKAPVRLDKRLTLEGEPGAVLEGSGKGSVVTMLAPEAVVRGLTIRGSGMDLERTDSGVFMEKSASRALVEGNRIESNLYGVYVHGAEDALVQKNTIIGIKEAGRINESGNGVSVWDAPGSKVIDNDVSFGRDGIFSVASRNNTFSRNRSIICASPCTTCTPTKARLRTMCRSTTRPATRLCIPTVSR